MFPLEDVELQLRFASFPFVVDKNGLQRRLQTGNVRHRCQAPFKDSKLAAEAANIPLGSRSTVSNLRQMEPRWHGWL
ncbi:MAG: hypothetical protein CMJ45_04040 [Planctomyces sp.]|nr:hypothetical protein [Planctomyces sp.]